MSENNQKFAAMSEDNQKLSTDICEFVVKVILDDCMYTELNLNDNETREAIADGLKRASEYFNNFNRTLH
jgi:predicted DNA-binding protein YlxM (UPF0122 family)